MEHTRTPDEPVAKATRRSWIGLAVIALPCLVYSMDLTVLNLAVPHLTADLKPSAAQLLWIMDIYGFLVAGFLLTMGTLGDRIGRRRLLMIGATAFGIASVVAAFSTSAEMLIVTRGILGIAAATLAPSTLSLIRNMFLDPRERTIAISIWATSFSVGGLIGPLIGGVLLDHYWWGSVLLIGVPVMALLLLVGPFLLPEYKDENAGRLDLFSAVLSLSAVLAMIYGLKRAAESGFDGVAAMGILIGFALGAAFVHRQGRLSDPLIDIRLFRAPAFSVALATNLFGIFVTFGLFFYLVQYLQLVLGLSPLHAGLWLLPSSAGFVVGSMSAPMVSRWFDTATAIALGLSVSAAGALVWLLIGVESSPGNFAFLILGSTLIALGLAPTVTLTTDVIVSSAPPERAGAASGISETGCELGGALGLAVLGSIGAALYRTLMSNAMPLGLEAETASTIRSTLGGALSVADQLPAPVAEQITYLARLSFVDAMELASVIGAVIMLLLAAGALVILRRRPNTASEAAPESAAAE